MTPVDPAPPGPPLGGLNTGVVNPLRRNITRWPPEDYQALFQVLFFQTTTYTCFGRISHVIVLQPAISGEGDGRLPLIKD